MNKISINHLVKSYNSKKVVDGISLELSKGEVVGLLGANGAGKTTTFYMTIGIVKPEEGAILLDDTDITKFPMYKRARLGISYLPQEASSFRHLSVEENILMLWQIRSMHKKDKNERLKKLLTKFGLWEKRKQKALSLSGGERRRVEIARSLAIEPDFLLLDEPFTGIDPIAISEIQKIVQNLKDDGIGVLITDHNVRETLAITNRAYIVYKGKMLVSGSPEEILESPVAKKYYLGENFSPN
jgi:lipopolysaccharide export system ATP-binding protein